MPIRREPDDFRVDEEPDPALVAALAASASAEAHVAVCRLAKRSVSTPDAASGLARALGLPTHAVRWAGLKDRHAATSQLVSIDRPPPHAVRSLERGIEGGGWRARTLGWSARHVDPGWIRGNAFEVAVRDLAPTGLALMHERAALLGAGEDGPWFTNYFGDQRFGSARHGKGFAARSLLAGDIAGAIRLLVGTPARKDHGPRRAFTRACARSWGEWAALAVALPALPERAAIERLAAGAPAAEAFMALPAIVRSMAVESFQSLLWNDGARRMVLDAVPGAVVSADDFGPLCFAPATAIPPAWRGCEPPMHGPGMQFREPWGPAWRAALEAEGLSPDALTVPALPSAAFGTVPRPLLARAGSFSIEDIAPEGRGRSGAWLRFSLPRGAYATVLLRALGQ